MLSERRERDLVHTPKFNDDLRYWISTNQRIATRILDLIEAIRRDPFRGIGKPEPVKHLGPNTWLRRIDGEHRLLYSVEHDRIVFHRARHQYER